MPHERHKLGLLDAGGMVLHQLFGVATSGDVATSRQLIRQVRDSNKQILHKANELVSEINQTYNELSLHRTHLLDIEKSVTQLYAQVNTLKRVIAIRFERMRSFMSVDRSCMSVDRSCPCYKVNDCFGIDNEISICRNATLWKRVD